MIYIVDHINISNTLEKKLISIVEKLLFIVHYMFGSAKHL